jgi:predicted component of type VI protein secretion system
MTSAIARAGQIHCLLAAIVLAGCPSSTPSTPVRAVDLIRELDRGEKRPPRGFAIAEHQLDGVVLPVIAAVVPSRLTLPLPLPRHGVLRAMVALSDPAPGVRAAAVRLRVGVSDHRIYEGITEVILRPGERTWMDIRADLSAYAGWKWSLFYRPDRTTWRVVLAADATDNVPATVFWGMPEIVTDTTSARDYAARRQRMR